MTPDAALPIRAEQAALMAHALSMHVGTCDAAMRPHLARALGFGVTPGRCEVTMILSTRTGRQVLDDLRAGSRIAAVFSHPASNGTFQLKGERAWIVPIDDADHARVEAYLEQFRREVGPLGFSDELLANHFRHERAERIGIRFQPSSAFDQTPGPQAGAALHG